MIRSLIVDDEPKNIRILTGLLTEFCPGVQIVGQAADAEAARDLIAEKNPDLVFLDIEMPHGNAFDLLDSILPVMEARQAQLVESDFALDDQVWLEPTPGHTPGHVSIRLASRGAHAVISGDAIHSPVQCLEPDWIMRADFDPNLARTTRRSFLERYCDSGVMVCATHFPEPSIGRVTQRDEAFWFEFRM